MSSTRFPTTTVREVSYFPADAEPDDPDPKAHDLLDDRRVKAIRPLIPPQILTEELPLTLRGAQTVLDGRRQVEAVVKGDDDRLLVVVG